MSDQDAITALDSPAMQPVTLPVTLPKDTDSLPASDAALSNATVFNTESAAVPEEAERRVGAPAMLDLQLMPQVC